jgi:hypothetical protein
VPALYEKTRSWRALSTDLPIAANEDISRHRVKYLESWLADLEQRSFGNTAFHGTQDEKLELSQPFRSRSEAETLENAQAENLDITAVPATCNLL